MSEQQAQGADVVVDLNNELKTRREKLAALREQGVPFPNDFRRDHTSDQLHADFDAKENEELEALNVEVVKILTANNNIDSRNFDGLIEQLIENDGVAVVDNGAATFVPLMSYMAENQVPELLHESGVRLIVHVPMNGGQALEDCMTGLAQTLRAIDADVVVWLNDFKGEVKDGNKAFQDFKIYKEGQHRIIGVVHIPNRNPDTFGKDIQRMTELNLTFGEADTSPEFTLMPRQRLRTVKRDIYRQLDEITFLATAAEVSDEPA